MDEKECVSWEDHAIDCTNLVRLIRDSVLVH